MANTSINVRMDADLKRQFEAFCADIGMTMTTAINVFAKKAVISGKSNSCCVHFDWFCVYGGNSDFICASDCSWNLYPRRYGFIPAVH